MRYMFQGCKSLTELNLEKFNTKQVTNMAGMFNGCNNLKTIYVSEYNSETNEGWTTSLVTDSVNMFVNSINLVGGNGTIYDANHLDVTYARIDTADAPGYFTNIKNKT